jgi:hypothetical protein
MEILTIQEAADLLKSFCIVNNIQKSNLKRHEKSIEKT